MIDTKDFILDLLKNTGKINGRKKVQKITYILQQSGVPIDEYFKYHLFGPYSANLQLKIDEMVDNKYLIKEEKDISKNTGFNYELNPDDEYINSSRTNTLKEYKKLISYLNKQPSVMLELVATIFFLKAKGSEFKSEKSIKERIKILKPSLEDKLDEAFSIFRTIVKEFQN